MLKPVPYEATAHRFLFTGQTSDRDRRVTVVLNELSLVPLIEAIGLGIERSRYRIEKLSVDAVYDAFQLLRVLDAIMTDLSRNGAPVHSYNQELVKEAMRELGTKV